MGSRHRSRLDALETRIGPLESPSAVASREIFREALATLARLIHAHADEIRRECSERVGRGEGYKDALIAAKRAAWGRSEEGRAALAVADAVRERGEPLR